MFGLSFPKLVVLVAVVAAVWFGFRWFQRWDKERRARDEAEEAAARRARHPHRLEAEELTACRVCGAFVAAGATACARRECPYPR